MCNSEEMYNIKQSTEKPRGRTHWQWLIAIIANFTLLTYGMQSGWVSPTIKYLQSPDSPTGYPLTDTDISWVGSVLTIAAAVGVPFYSYVADKFGRKTALLIIVIAQLCGWAIKFSSSNVIIILIARAFCGFATGGCFGTVPMYVREITQDNIRGQVGSLLIMLQNIGYLLIFAIGKYLDYFSILWAVIWIPLVTFLMLLKAPESPAFLVKIGKVEEAAKAIAFLRSLDKDDEIVQKEISTMRKDDEYFKSLPAMSFISILKNKAWRRSFMLMMAVITIHAGNGTYAIVTYASLILSASSSDMDSELQSLTFPAVMILASFASMSCVERYGRKPVLVTSLILIIVTMLTIASLVLAQYEGLAVAAWIPFMSMIVSVAAYAFGLSPVPFIMLSEIFNFEIRAKLLGVIVTYAWIISAVQLLIFYPLHTTLGLHGAFYFFSGINVVGLFLTIILVPETRGKTVEQIEAEFRNK